ncbi:protein ACCELERATED CELL DEATH 6-like isoform X1 [Cynara cardunculus var. scolymus]|nr:protein ACCELERATED CELL DEATH 6-like isoform X1 [Cynara cardunculus var. scolymus]
MNTPNGNRHHQINIVSASHNQPSQLPPLNLPRRDLLDGGDDFNAICIPLYKALTSNDFKAVKVILDKRPMLVQFSITESCETILHIAVLLGKSCVLVQYLMSLMTKEDLELPNGSGETALCLVARTGNVEIAKILVEKNDGLIDIPNSEGRLPLQVAVLYGRHEMVEYLYNTSQRMTGHFWTHQDRSWVLEKCVDKSLFDLALQMAVDLPELAINGSILRLLARRPYTFYFLKFRWFYRLKSLLKGALKFRFDYHCKGDDLIKLLGMVLTQIMKLPKVEIDDIIRGPPDETTTNTEEDAKQKYSSRLLFHAAEMGNTEFVVEVIRQYPHLALDVNDDNQSIFHVAVLHRNEGIYKLLHEIDHIRNSIVTLEDKNGNNMLHLVSQSTMGYRRLMVSGLQMNKERLWYREVEGMLPSHLCRKKNAAGLTPYELFIKNHKDLFSKEKKLMKQMVTQLMVVEALIATISFAAVFTFPGGYNQTTGTPILLQKTLSKFFIIFDSLSFLSSTTSILVVLHLIMFDGFAHALSISSKLVTLCLTLAFFSIATIILTFLINLLLLYQNNYDWLPTLILCSAAVPFVVLYVLQTYVLNGHRTSL